MLLVRSTPTCHGGSCRARETESGYFVTGRLAPTRRPRTGRPCDQLRTFIGSDSSISRHIWGTCTAASGGVNTADRGRSALGGIVEKLRTSYDSGIGRGRFPLSCNATQSPNGDEVWRTCQNPLAAKKPRADDGLELRQRRCFVSVCGAEATSSSSSSLCQKILSSGAPHQ